MIQHKLVIVTALLSAHVGVGLSQDPPSGVPDPQTRPVRILAPNHSIRLKVQQVTPVENGEQCDLAELKVCRWYGKISADSSEKSQRHDTQELKILFPTAPGETVKAGDIIDYQFVRRLSFGEGESAETVAAEPPDRQAWVRQCLEDFGQIKPGMTRAEVEKLFSMDGGWYVADSCRFCHPDCPLFKVDVGFSVSRNPEDQNRVSIGPEDKVTTVSKPYLEQPYSD